MTASQVVYISCGIFREELEYLVRERGLDWKVIFLDAALHVNFDRLKAKLVETLEGNKKPGVEIRVIYGYCHPEMSEILDQHGAKKIKAANCLEAMVGPEELEKLDSEAKSFYLTVGWANNWEKMFAVGKEDFNFDFKSFFSSYKRIVVFDTGIVPVDEAKVAMFSKFTSLPVERKRISLDRLYNLISSM
jgi:hypothetical protein